MPFQMIKKPTTEQSWITLAAPVPFMEQMGLVRKQKREPVRIPGKRSLSTMRITGDEIIIYKQDIEIDGVLYIGVLPMYRHPDGSVECVIDAYRELGGNNANIG